MGSFSKHRGIENNLSSPSVHMCACVCIYVESTLCAYVTKVVYTYCDRFGSWSSCWLMH